MTQRLLARLDDLQPRGARLLVAFSGGGDSTALAIGMAEAQRAGRVRPWLGHVEHRVRPDAGGDAVVALGTAERLGLPLTIRSVPPGAIGGHVGCGPEEAMRRERYELLTRMAEETDSTAVATAHHADDQAETVLGHLIRGSGLDGAAGIRASGELIVPWWPSSVTPRTLRLIRPILGERHVALLDLVASVGLDVVVDATNDDRDRTRAALRHEVLPALERIQPGASSALARFAEVVGEGIEGQVEVDPSPSGRLSVDAIRPLVVGEQRSALRAWVRRASGLTLSFERTEAIRVWILADGVGRVEIGRGRGVTRSRGMLTIDEPTETERAETTW